MNEKLTSAQINQLDADHANSLDKTAAGDTISGTVAMAAAGLLDGNTSGTHFRVSTSGAKIAATASGAVIEANASGAFVQATAAGSKLRVTGGAVIEADVAAIAGDRYTLSSAQTRNVQYAAALGAQVPAGAFLITFVSGFPQLLGQAVTTTVYLPFTPHNGATLDRVQMWLQVGQSHAGVPANLPALNIVRVKNNAGAAATDSLLAADQLFTPAPGTGAAWFNGGSLQSWTAVCTQNNVIDTSQYDYFVKLTDENGANSLINNTYPWFIIRYTNILDLRFST